MEILLYGELQKLCQQQNGTANARVRLLQLHIANSGGFFIQFATRDGFTAWQGNCKTFHNQKNIRHNSCMRQRPIIH